MPTLQMPAPAGPVVHFQRELRRALVSPRLGFAIVLSVVVAAAIVNVSLAAPVPPKPCAISPREAVPQVVPLDRMAWSPGVTG